MAMNLSDSAGSGEPEVMMDINTTPVIDVMLVLLIMLIITIPAQLHSVNLDITAASSVSPRTTPVVVKINIDERNTIFWNGKALSDVGELERKLQEASASNPQPELHIRPNGKAKYETVMTVMARAQRLNLTKLGILGSEQFAN